MVRLTTQETWTLFFPVLATLLIIVIYGIVHFTISYGFAYVPKYEKTEAVIGNSTGKIPSTSTHLNARTNTTLRTYTDPAGFFTLQYPANWTVEYKQPVTKFDNPKVNFAPYGGGSIVTIAVKPSLYSSPEDFRGTLSLLTSYFAANYPTLTILGHGFEVYSIAGYDTYL